MLAMSRGQRQAGVNATYHQFEWCDIRAFLRVNVVKLIKKLGECHVPLGTIFPVAFRYVVDLTAVIFPEESWTPLVLKGVV